MRRTRVLVVDDSAFTRKVIRELLAAQPDLEVVDIARDGGDALEKVAALTPDVITLDLMMPVIDGAGVLRALAALPSPPRVVVVSTSGASSERGVEALQLGAVAVVQKPTSLATDRMYELGQGLVDAVRLAADAKVRPALIETAPVAVERGLPSGGVAVAQRTGVLVIGASTGGPPALTRLLLALPQGFPVPIAVVLHLPAEYTGAFARRLDKTTPHDVVEASDGVVMRPGRVVVARGDLHLTFARRDGEVVTALRHEPSHLHRPAVDVLFASAAQIYGASTLALVLTGMGVDGSVGARSIHEVGGRILTESESSCVVYGMPRAVVEAGFSEASAPLEDLAALVLRSL